MARWDRRTIELTEPHGWHSRPGYNVFVADRGAVRFDFPESWLIIPDESGTIKFHDRQPPDDDCTLAVSVMYLPPADWSRVPLALMLEEVIRNDPRGVTERGPVHSGGRTDLDLVWSEIRFHDATQDDRPARSRGFLLS